MIGLFRRPPRRAAPAPVLGPDSGVIALRLARGQRAPDGCVTLLFDSGSGSGSAAGPARRAHTTQAHQPGEVAWCFHPGPYTLELVPFEAAPEWGLHVRFAIGDPDPRVTQQRFDLFLSSEAGAASDDGLNVVTVFHLAGLLQASLRRELLRGHLALPPCVSVTEWHAFRAGLNRLSYTRFGITLDDCVPLDLGERVDLAAQLAARARQPAEQAPARPRATEASAAVSTELPAPPVAPLAPLPPLPPPDAGLADACALRRLFLELPAVGQALRGLAPPPGRAAFAARQALLQRLDLAGADVATMPTLAWASPDLRLDPRRQARRARYAVAATGALDEAWAWLARCDPADPERLAAWFDEADRIASNLEHALRMRRLTHDASPSTERLEPA